MLRATLMTTARWAARNAAGRFRAVEQIANEGRPPEEWLKPYRSRLEQLSRGGGGAQDIERAGREAQQHCLRQLDRLVHFMREGQFYDSPDSKAVTLEALEERRAQWAAGDWRTLLAWND